jgi:hypothetical protein
MTDRHRCACLACPCSSSAHTAGNPCPSCSVGVHRPSEVVQRHVARGLDAWIEAMPVTLGSSGLSDKQLRQAAAAWESWHAQQPCPLIQQYREAIR